MHNPTIVNILLILTLVFSAPLYAEVNRIDSAELARLTKAGVPVIDVRTPPEWQRTGVLEDSHLMMFFDEQGQYNAERWLARLAEIVEPGEPFVLICHSGRRSAMISQFLDQQAGYQQVHDASGGITDWLQTGGATTAPDPNKHPCLTC